MALVALPFYIRHNIPTLFTPDRMSDMAARKGVKLSVYHKRDTLATIGTTATIGVVYGYPEGGISWPLEQLWFFRLRLRPVIWCLSLGHFAPFNAAPARLPPCFRCLIQRAGAALIPTPSLIWSVHSISRYALHRKPHRNQSRLSVP